MNRDQETNRMIHLSPEEDTLYKSIIWQPAGPADCKHNEDAICSLMSKIEDKVPPERKNVFLKPEYNIRTPNQNTEKKHSAGIQ